MSTVAPSRRDELAPAPRNALGSPALAAVSLTAEGDGVAYAARLLQRALVMMEADTRAVELSPRSRSGPSRHEQLRFLARLTAEQARGATWVLFTHLGLARAQRWVPSPWQRPYAVFLHGIEVWDPGLEPGRKAALAGARLRIANSSYTAARISRAHPTVGPIAACPLVLHPDDEAAASPPGKHAILGSLSRSSVVIIGRMSAAERYKGHDELIECWPLVLDAVPEAQLVVVGTGDDRERLMRKASAAQLREHVVFTGFVDDAVRDALLARAAIFAMPSRGEGFGIVYLQAMRAGTPCIGSVADAAGDLIVDGETGRLVDPDDRQALAAAIVALLKDEPRRRRMGEAGRRRYQREFTFDRFRDRLSEVLLPAFGSHVGGR